MTSSDATSPGKADAGNRPAVPHNSGGLLLGVDGGGTKTVAWLALAGSARTTPLTTASSPVDHVDPAAPWQLIGRGLAGPSNQRAVGVDTALQNLEHAIQQAFTDAGLDRTTVHCACLGLAGADRLSDRSVITGWAEKIQLARHLHVVNDALPLLFAGDRPQSAGGTGVALICGTGSLALGRCGNGRSARTGGWGYLFGDEGSAFAMGRAALQAAAQAADGRGPATALLTILQHRLQVTAPQELISAVYGAADVRSVIASLACDVFQAAAERDAAASRILDQARQDLTLMVTSLARQLELQSDLSLFFAGSVLLQQPAFRAQLTASIAAAGSQIRSLTLVPEPVQGCVQLAWQHLPTHGST